MENKPQYKNKIHTRGLELVLIGVLAFAFIIGMTITAYRLFIIERVRGSEEFRVASYFAVNSLTVKEELLSPIESLQFDDIDVNESGGYGVCEIYFRLTLKDNLTQTLGVGLVKVADFWIVYDAVLNPDTPGEKPLVSTYQKTGVFLEKIDFQEWEKAEGILELIKKEMHQSTLEEFLTAKLNAANGNDIYALQLLEDLSQRVDYAKLAVMNEMALIYFNRHDFAKTTEILLDMDKIYKDDFSDDDEDVVKNIFSDLPKDPFQASLDPSNVIASARKLLGIAYNNTGEYAQGLEWAEKAIALSDKIKSSVLHSSSVYVKALNLYSLQRYEEAEEEFKSVIYDIDNPNLSQKAWSYYFRADIAARFNRPSDSLDFYEIAVNLDPRNAFIRKGAIEYLMKRSYVGDLEIALGMALRGIDHEVDKAAFKSLAARLYGRLGMADKTKGMD